MRSFRRSVCVAAKARFFVHVQGLVAVVERGRCRTVEVSLGRAEKAIKQNLYLASFTLVTGCSDRCRGLGCVANNWKISNYLQHNCLLQVAADLQHSVNQP